MASFIRSVLVGVLIGAPFFITYVVLVKVANLSSATLGLLYLAVIAIAVGAGVLYDDEQRRRRSPF
jgi:uncharacterized membrane protein